MALEDQLHGLLGRYIAAPQWLRSPLGLGYRLLPQALRHGAGYAAFAAQAACKDRDAIAQLAGAKLATTLKTALLHVPAFAAYRDLIPEIAHPYRCLGHFPITAKDHIKRNLDAYLSRATRPARRMRMFTGGSTAQPMAFFLERHVTRCREAAYVETFSRDLLDWRAEDRTLSLHGRTVSGAGRDGGRLWMYEPIRRQLILSSDHLERRYMPEYVSILRSRRPAQIHAYPSALQPLALWLVEHPCAEYTDAVRGILLTSENVNPGQIELFRAAFPAARIVKHYGHSERVLMALSLGDAAEYHFSPLYGHLELVDRAGQPITTPGETGEIVGTSFDNSVMPFVRYRTGDLGVWEGPSILRSIEGRVQEFIVCLDHRLVSITTLGAAHFSELAAADCIQYEQSEPGRVTLRVVTPNALDKPSIGRIERAVRDKTQGGCEVRVCRVPRIERTARGKHQMLIQHLDLGSFFGAGGSNTPLAPQD